ERIGVAGRDLAGGLLVIMTAVVMLQVVARYGFNNSLPWTEEFSKTLMVWTAFLVAPWAYRHGANVSIEIFSDAFPRLLRNLLLVAITGLVLWIAAVFFIESLAFVERGMNARAASLPVATGVFYIIVPISFAALFLTGCEHLLRNLANLLGADLPPPEHLSRREG
ncbi:MAG: TRAP transporter small permease, partial [Pseudomonadota bacterium]